MIDLPEPLDGTTAQPLMYTLAVHHASLPDHYSFVATLHASVRCTRGKRARSTGTALRSRPHRLRYHPPNPPAPPAPLSTTRRRGARPGLQNLP